MLLLTAASGAWAADTYTITFSGFGNEACNKTITDATLEYSETFKVSDVYANYIDLGGVGGSNDYVSISYQGNDITITVKSPFEGTVKVTVYYQNENWDESQSDISVTCVKSAPAVKVTTNAASEGATFTEASFQMPAFDATAEYELVRDMSYQVIPVMADRIRIKKSGSTYTPVDLLSVIPTVTDNLDAQNPVEMEWGTDYEMTLEKKGENNEWVATTDYSVGTFRAVIHGLNLYDGIIYTNEFQLFEGYEVTVPAGEYVTYFKDENLYVEDPEAQLYTITSVGTETATATELTVAKANMPILVKNNGQEKKVILLIPTTNQADEVTVASEFVGTLEATTIAASSENQNNYAFNGKQFVWVKNAIEVGANRAWLHILTGAQSAPVLTIVFEGGTTKITNTNITNITNGNWYDLNGRKLNGMPSKKGVYLFNGKKVVVK